MSKRKPSQPAEEKTRFWYDSVDETNHFFVLRPVSPVILDYEKAMKRMKKLEKLIYAYEHAETPEKKEACLQKIYAFQENE